MNSVTLQKTFKLFCLCFFFVFAGATQTFGSAAGYSEFILPADEDNLSFVLDDLYDWTNEETHSIITVTAWAGDTVVYYDHWEDGYEFDPDDPGASTFDETFTLANKGDAQTLESIDITLGRTVDTSIDCSTISCPYDGRDIIFVAGGSATVTRAGWIQEATTYQAVAWEVYPVRPQLIKYILPFGEDLNSSGLLDFERVYAFIQATGDGTVVQIDFDNDGTFDSFDHDRDGIVDGTTFTLNRGEVYLLDRNSDGNGNPFGTLDTGATIIASKTIQVQYIIGDEGVTYEVRGLSAFPRGFWDDEYYAPVDESTKAGYSTDIFTYNPHSSPLTINWETIGASGTYTVPIKSTVSFNAQTGAAVPVGGAVYLKGSDIFWGISTIDTEGQINDWGYSLVPASLLDQEHYMGWAPAYDFDNLDPPYTRSNPDDQRSGLFITAASDNITVYIDEDNDGTPDQTFSLDRLETAYVTSSNSPAVLNDDDLSQTRIFATGPYALAYGQNPDFSFSGDSPALDLGYTVLPTTDKWFDLVLDVEKIASPKLLTANTAGEQTTFTITVSTGKYSVDAIEVHDALPAGWEYVTGSTVITLPDNSQVTGSTADDSNSDGDTDLTWTGSDVFGSYADLAENQSIIIAFVAETSNTSFNAGDITTNNVDVVGYRTVGEAPDDVTQTFTAEDFDFVTYGNSLFTVEKSTSGVDPLHPGDSYTYTVNVENTGSNTLTDVSLYDPLPDGIQFDAGTTRVTLSSSADAANVLDEFSTSSYTNNNGSDNWSAGWTETDTGAGAATGGLVSVSGNELRFQYNTGSANFRDEFETVAYGNSDGTTTWSPDWFETDSLDGGASSGSVSVTSAADGQLQFAYMAGVSGNVADNFGSVSYGNSDGSDNWAPDWSETDSYGEDDDSGAADGFVQVSGGALEFTYLLSTVRDDFDTASSFTENDGTDDWSTTWTENDGGGAGGGDIEIEQGRLEFQDTTDGGEWIERSANILGATSVTVSWYWDEEEIDRQDDFYVEYEIDNSGIWNTIRVMDREGDGLYSDTFTWDPTDATITLRIRAEDDLANNEEARFNWVQIEYNKPVDASTTQIVRSVDLSDASAATLTFDYSSANLESGDTVVVEASSNGSGYTTLASYDGANSGNASVDLTSYLSANTSIRFRVTSGINAINESFSIDNVLIDYTSSATNGNGAAITRSADLASASSGTLTFDYNSANLESGDTVVAQASPDGSVFTTIATYNGNVSGSASLDISGYLSASSVIRFTVTSGLDDTGELFSIDDVNISYSYASAANGSSIVRAADLSSTSGATLSFDYSGSNLEAGDTVIVEASSDGSSFSTLATYDGATSGSSSFDLVTPTNYTSANTTVRFRVTSGIDNSGEYFAVDNVEINYLSGSTLSALNGNSPPNFISSGDGIDIAAGEVLTLTFDVTVDDPLTTGITDILNTVYVTTNEFLLPLSDDAYNIVTTPSTVVGEIGDLVWFDINNNGTKDVGENGIANVEITLKDDFGTPLATTVTDGNGRYRFTGVEAADGYYVEITDGLPAGLVQSAPTGHSDNQTDPIDLSAGEIYLDADLGYTSAASTAIIGDYIWLDSDGDGMQDLAEQGLANITVGLYIDTNEDGVLQAAELSAGPADTEVTGADGSYLFTGVTASGTDDYIVYVDASQSNLTDFTATTGTLTSLINIDGGEFHLLNDFGFLPDPVLNPRYSYKDRVWFDANEDQNDDGENGNGISGVTVDLLDASLNVIATTLTASDGTFEFDGLDPSTFYTARITDNNSRLTDYFGTTTGAVSGEFKITDITADIDYTIEPLEPHFGYSVDGAIGDTVFNDIDGDGLQGSGELGLAYVAVTLYHDANGNGLLEAGETASPVTTRTTDANGNYMFSGLDDDDYIVSVNTNPTGFTIYTSEPPSGDNDSASGAQQSVTISGGNSVLTADFGYQAPVQRSLSGTIWYDASNDGVLDGTETGIEDVTVELYEDTNSNGVIDSGETLLATVTTPTDGTYQFTGLPSGDYVVVVTDTYGMLNNYQTTYEVDEGSLASSYDSEESIDLNSGDASAIDFGYYRPLIITRAIIGDFTAYKDNGKVVIQWQTVSEHGTIGFYLHRYNEETGRYRPVHQQFLPGLMHSPTGGTYSLIDESAVVGNEYTYKLIEIEAKGKRRSYGPYSVTTDKKSLSSQILSADVDRSLTPTGDDAYKMVPHGISEKGKQRLVAASNAKNNRFRRKIGSGAVKIAVDADGLYFLNTTEIADTIGISSNRVRRFIKKNKLSLKNLGRPVAYIPAEDNSGIFFYGEEIASQYTNQNIYWLSLGQARKNHIMEIIEDVPPLASTGYEVFVDTIHFEENNWPITAFFDDPETDYWFWDYIVAGNPTLGKKDFNLSSPGTAGIGTALLRVELMGSSETDHHVAILLNGDEVGGSYWSGTEGHTVEISVEQTQLNDGDNLVEIRGLLDTGVPYSVFYVNSFDLTLNRHYQAVDDSLVVRGDTNSVITIDNFSSDDILVFSLSDRTRPKLLVGTTIEKLDTDNYQISFIPENPSTEYMAVTLGSTKDVVSLSADKPSKLKSKHNKADYLIISPLELYEAANRLAEYRAGNGYTAMVVELEDIMDQFNHGITSPHAIKKFIRLAYSKWQLPPEYVVLLGDGSFDYKNYRGNGDSLLPPLMGSTPHGLFALDNQFADVRGNDSLPELAIGRIPVLTAEELDNYIDKVIAFENSVDWPKKALLIADYTGADDPFTQQSESIAELFPSDYIVGKAHLSEDSVSVSRSKILSAINSDLSIVNFVGHAGLDRLSSDGMLITSDGVDMTNNESPFLMTALTCIAGRFDLSGYVTLSETLILQENSGAVAVWSSTGLSENYESQILGENFYQTLFDVREAGTIGAAAVRAINNYSSQGTMPYMLNLYNLLGDPALSIR